MDATTLNLTLSEPEQVRALFGALLCYIEGHPVVIFAPNKAVLHGTETLEGIVGANVGLNCACIFGIDPHEFESSDWPELLEAARINWMQGATPGDSYVEFVKAGAQ